MVDVPKAKDQPAQHEGAPPATLNTVDVMQGHSDAPKTGADGKQLPADGSLDLSGITRDKQGRVSQVENQNSHDVLWAVKYADDKSTNVQSLQLKDTPSDWISIDKQKDGSYLINWNPPRNKTLAPIQVYDVQVDQKTGAISFDSHHKGSVDHITWETNGEIEVNGKVPSLEHPVVWYESAPKKGGS